MDGSWKIAVPVVILTIVLLMYSQITEYLRTRIQRRQIGSMRKRLTQRRGRMA
jgi:hypothetical protein